MNKNKWAIALLIRYVLLLLLGLGNLYLIYLIFTPLTVYPVYFILSLFYQVSLHQATLSIFTGETLKLIEIAGACVAGSAFYLLYILNLTTPMKAKTRLYSLIYSSLALLLINILRIILLSFLSIKDYASFEIIHKLFWYFLSTILVVLIWFSQVYFFNIKAYPILTDFKELKKQIKK